MGVTGCPCSPGRSEWCRRDPAGRGGSGENPPTTTIFRGRQTGHQGTSCGNLGEYKQNGPKKQDRSFTASFHDPFFQVFPEARDENPVALFDHGIRPGDEHFPRPVHVQDHRVVPCPEVQFHERFPFHLR